MPPTPEWRPIEIGARCWSIEKLDAAGWSLRTMAVPLGTGKLLVVSPIRGLPEETFTDLAAIGEPAVILAPNHFHHMGVPEWHKRFPSARVVASERALPRLRKKSSASYEPLSSVVAELPAGLRLLEPEGTRSGETWLRLEGDPGVAWVVSDAFMNVEQRVTGAKGLLLRALNVASGLRIATPFKMAAVRDRAAYRSWVHKQLDADRPHALVVGHGSPLLDPALPDRLRRLVDKRLG